MLSSPMSHAKELSSGVEERFVYFHLPSLAGESLDTGARHWAHELRNVREPCLGGGGPPDRNRLAGSRAAVSCSGIMPLNGQPLADLPTSASAEPSAGPIRTPRD